MSAIELSKVLKRLGFELIRQEGSHMFFRHPDGRTTVVPNHSGENIGRGLLVKIIKKDVQITREEFEKLL
ncbi:MAG: type II toxin-antitoxin system HicA family toxin [Nanoarchaeota archaeon]